MINDLVSGPSMKSAIKIHKSDKKFLDTAVMSYRILKNEEASK